MNLALNPTKPKKLGTPDRDCYWEASTTALTFSLVGPIPCLVKRGPMKTTFVILKVHFSAFTVSPLSLSLSNTLIKFVSCYSESCPCTIRSSAILVMSFRPAIVWVMICWYFSRAALTPKLNRLYWNITSSVAKEVISSWFPVRSDENPNANLRKHFSSIWTL